MNLLDHSPRFDLTAATDIANSEYGIQATAVPLPSERDQNFLLTTNLNEQFVLKISNFLEDQALLEAQNAIMSYLESRVDICQRVVTTLAGKEITRIGSEHHHLVRLVTFIPGTPLAKVETQSNDLLRDLGRKLAQVDRALLTFDHPAVHREFHWDLARARDIVGQYGPMILNPRLRDLVQRCASDFEMPDLRRSIIHGDANDYNVIVAGSEVVGLIDFGDVVHSYTIADLAIAIAYVVLDRSDPLNAASEVVAGYNEELPLTETEFAVLFDLMILRLCMSVCHAAHQRQSRPDNEYLNISQAGVERALTELSTIDRVNATRALRG